jgi:hypothetical protein
MMMDAAIDISPSPDVPEKRRRKRHNTAENTVVIRQYRLMPPENWGEDCEEQLRRMTALWNRLVEIDRAHCDKYRAATADDPIVKELRGKYNAATAGIERLIAGRKEARAQARKRVPTPEIDDRIAALKIDRKTIAAQLGEATRKAREAARPCDAASRGGRCLDAGRSHPRAPRQDYADARLHHRPGAVC